MSYTIFSPGHEIIRLLSGTSGNGLQRIIPSAAAVHHASGEFGNFLLQKITVQDFTIYWDCFDLKEALTIEHAIKKPCAFIKVIYTGSSTQQLSDTNKFKIKEDQFYMAYTEAQTVTSVVENTFTSFTICFPVDMLKSLFESLPYLKEDINDNGFTKTNLLFNEVGNSTWEMLELITSLMDCNLREDMKSHYFKNKVQELIALLTIQKHFEGKVMGHVNFKITKENLQ
jgi:hypothetical protein